MTSDPGINLPFALDGLGITILPLWMAKHPDNRTRLVPILPLWKPEPNAVDRDLESFPPDDPDLTRLLGAS